MSDGTILPSMDCAGELRRIIARRFKQRRRLAVATLTGAAAIPLVLLLAWKPSILLVWNASASAPVGLYWLHAGKPVRRGDMVVAWMPEPDRMLAARRHYLPSNVPLVKRVAAISGDRVCAVGSAVSINGTRVAARKPTDAAGRRMPWWNGCRRLGKEEYFLLMDSPLSFDGRYFGLTRGDHVLGRAELLWRRPAEGSNHG